MPFELFEKVYTQDSYRHRNGSGTTTTTAHSSQQQQQQQQQHQLPGSSAHANQQHAAASSSGGAWRGAHSGAEDNQSGDGGGGSGDLLVDDNLGFAKDRTISRLTEMQSLEYLAAHADAHDPSLKLALQEALDKKHAATRAEAQGWAAAVGGR